MTSRSALLGLSFSLSMLVLPVVAEAAPGFARSAAALRAGPGAEYPRIGGVSRGEPLEVYGCIRGYSWCDVSTGADRGWFPGSRVEFVRDGRRMRLADSYGLLGLSIMTFGRNDYWDRHYRNRPWYNDRHWNGRPHDGRPPRFGKPDLREPDQQAAPPRPPKGPDGMAPGGRPKWMDPKDRAEGRQHAGPPPMRMKQPPQDGAFGERAPRPMPGFKGAPPEKGNAPGGGAPKAPACRPPQPC